jgi:hypothetical protein
MIQIFDNKANDLDAAVFQIDQIAQTCADGHVPTVNSVGDVINPCQTTITKTGLQVTSFMVPENGGDTSAGLFIQTGGGNALSVFKLSSTHRPAGFQDYSDNRSGAMEVGTSDGSWAALFEAGGFDTTKISNAIYARIDNSVSKGILVAPGDGAFNSRRAIQVGSHNINAANANVKFSVRLDGRTSIGTDTPGTILEVSGSEANTQIGAGDLAAFKIANTNTAGAHLSEIQFGTSDTTRFSAIGGVVRDANQNTAGDLVFGVRPSTTDANLIAGMTLTRTAQLQLAGDFMPVFNAAQDLGSSSLRWRNLTLSSGIVTPRLAAAGATGTNQAGSTVRVEGGVGTGSGKGGDVLLTTSPSIASGSTVQTSVRAHRH